MISRSEKTFNAARNAVKIAGASPVKVHNREPTKVYSIDKKTVLCTGVCGVACSDRIRDIDNLSDSSRQRRGKSFYSFAASRAYRFTLFEKRKHGEG